MSLSAGARFGPYEILAPLGAGGMGEVYRARDARLEREVAVKALPTGFSSDPERLHRFIREAKVLASLNHPNISAIYGLEELPSGERLLVLELIEGETLAERLKRGALAIPEVLRVCGAIAEALEAAHERGVIHRDLKPGNVMLTPRGVVKVLDFGLARRSEVSLTDRATGAPTVTALTEVGQVIGTPGYMSPEHVRGEEHDRRTDIFAFGCVLFECLTGRRAFGGATKMDAIAAVLNAEPPWSLLPRDAPQPIRGLLARCLEKDPRQRLRDIGDARIEIEEAREARPPARAPVSATQHNLPKQLTSFVGREREIAECDALLCESRLLTLSGIGGCGKTRLALKVADSRLEAHPDGVWFVDLAPVSDPDRVPVAVATAASVREEPGKPILETLTRHLAEKRTLVVLDNCEHVLLACATLSERLLASAPELRLLATSREGLGVKGERSYAVPPLSVPAPDTESEVHAIETSEAVRLFVDRARVIAPDFRLTEETTSVVAEICRRLDGLPLAIELAAARVRFLSVDQIRAKLDDRFRLLTGGSKTAIPRHRTLLATIQWSYDNLAPGEQRFFRLLSVFAGSWSLGAAAAVAGEDNDEFVSLDHLMRLVDKSLVVVERDESGEAVYRMLETVREFAQERLLESGEDDGARRRHLDFYLAFAEQVEPKLPGPERGTWLARLDREQENVLAAHAHCDHARDGAAKGLRLVGALSWFWEDRGLRGLGLRLAQEALAREGVEPLTGLRARVLRAAAENTYRQGRYAVATKFLKESLSISRALVDADGTASVLRLLGDVEVAQGNLPVARRLFEESIAIWRELGKGRHALGLNSLAELLRAEGQLEEAVRLYEEALAINRERRSVVLVAINLLNLASVEAQRGRLAAARSRWAEIATVLGEDTKSKAIAYNVLAVGAGILAAAGTGTRAARLYGASEAMRERLGLRTDPADEQFIAPAMARARRELGASAFAAAFAAGRALSYDQALAEARVSLEER